MNKNAKRTPEKGVPADLEQRLTTLTETVTKQNEETETGIQAILDTLERLIEENHVLRIAIDDYRQEVELLMKRQGLSGHLKELPTPHPQLEPEKRVGCERCSEVHKGTAKQADMVGWKNIRREDGECLGTCPGCQAALDKEEAAKKQREAERDRLKQSPLFS